MSELPTIGNYMDYSSRNYGVNSLYFSCGRMTVYFSYSTPVAFEDDHGITVRENVWGPTTGKHINSIDDGDKKARINSDAFEQQLQDAITRLGFTLPHVA